VINIACCWLECGVVFGVPDHVHAQSKTDPKRWFHCPNGHKQHYEESTSDKLTKRIGELEETLTRVRALNTRLDEESTRQLRTISYWKGIAHRRRSR
jgi:hypothetical protein